jgi:hypothetical protein
MFVAIGLLLALAPVSFVNTRQANFISKWNEMYNKTDYMFQVINAQITDDVLQSFKKAPSAQREQMLIEIIKPYLRLNTERNVPRQYKPRYMNKAKVYKGQQYYFPDMFFTDSNTIVGIKDLPHYDKNAPNFIMMFDINGLIPPNRWGKDIFGINVYEHTRIEPFGQGLEMQKLKSDCSENGTGINCSYYYKIGGGFED